MSRETPQSLLSEWKQEVLPQARATGQVLQHMVNLYQENDDLRQQNAVLIRRQVKLETELTQVRQELAQIWLQLQKLAAGSGSPADK